jgi:hypothetical protein
VEITSAAELRALLGPVAPRAATKERTRLHEAHYGAEYRKHLYDSGRSTP